MKGRILNIVLVLVLTMLPMAANAGWNEAQQATDQPAPAQVEETPAPDVDFNSSPVMFIENAGQWDDGARFQVWGGPTGTMWLAEDAIWITVVEPGETSRQMDRALDPMVGWPYEEQEDLAPRRGVNIKLSFVGANPHPRIETFDRLDTTVSYFHDNDPEQWRPDVPVWGGVRYVDLYPGVDLELTNEAGQMAQRLAAQPDTDLTAVQLRVEGADAMVVGGDALRLSTAAGEFALPLLMGNRLQVTSAKVEANGVEAFEVTAPFVLSKSNRQSVTENRLTPSDNPADLLYGTFLGSSGSDIGHAIAVDGAGNTYLTGQTNTGSFPSTPGAFDPTFNGLYPWGDAFVVKLNSAGNGLTYATFLGGSSWDEGRGIAVDGAGSAYLTGNTISSNFPTTPGSFDMTANGNDDAFVVKLSPTGSSLAYSSYLGGWSAEFGRGIAVDEAGSAYVAGETSSNNFPTTPSGYDTSFNSSDYCGANPCSDAFAVKINSAGTGLAYATFLGGSNHDWGYGIAVDVTGNSFVAGATRSSNFPTTTGAFDTDHNGDFDAFVVRLNTPGSNLTYATFLGATYDDRGYSIAVDGTGNAYVTGYSYYGGFPVTWGAFDTTFNGYSDAFVVKLNLAGSSLDYATFLGGSAYEYGSSIAVDNLGCAYVTGWTGSGDFPTTPGAFDTSVNSVDTFVAKLNPTGSGLAYATFLGGSDWEEGRDIAVDEAASAYVTGATRSSDFPTTSGAFDTTYNNYDDAVAYKLAAGIVIAPLAGPLALTPLHPLGGQVSRIMQGGTAHRYFELRDANGDPAPFVTIEFSPAGSDTTSDANGRLDVTLSADNLGGPGSYSLVAVSASRWGQAYALADPASFGVEVHPRELTSFWGTGAAKRARIGIDAGVKGYITEAQEGGLDAELTELYPLSATDDVLQLTASQTNELGGAVGLGAEVSFEAGPVKGSIGTSAETGLTWKTLEEYASLFDDPYATEQQRAEAITALVGAYQTAQGLAQSEPGMNLLGQIILRLLQQIPSYQEYLVEETLGTGLAFNFGTDVGAKFDFLRFNKEKNGNSSSRALYLELGAESDNGVNALAKWVTDPATDATRALDWTEEVDVGAWAGMEAGLAYGARAKFAAEIGAIYSVEREAEYAVDGSLERVAYTVSSEVRNELEAGVDIDPLRPADIDWGAITGLGVQYQIKHRYIFEGALLDQALNRALGLGQLNAIQYLVSGANPMQLGKFVARRDLTALLGCTPTCLDGFTYEKWVDATTDLQPGLDLGFTLGWDLSLGGDFKVQWGKKVLLERGAFIGGEFYPTEVYTLDTYVDAPERDLWSLIGEAVQSAFAVVADFFNTVVQQIQAGAGWLFGIVARTGDGVIQGGLRLIGGGTELSAQEGLPPGVELGASSAFTLTATAWVPVTDLDVIRQARELGIQVTEPGFVVGGVYDLLPYTQTLSPAATLVITYTDVAVAGRDEALFRLYDWEPADNAWRPLVADVNPAGNAVTAIITSLGSYAVGFDNQAPVIEEIVPGPGPAQATYRPDFRITLRDAGSGVDPDSVQLTVAGAPVSALFDPVLGRLWYTPTVSFANGVYAMTIQAADTTGNEISVTSPFTIAVPAPVVGGVSPDVALQGITTTVIITGSGFYPGLALDIGPHNVPDFAYLSAGKLSTVVASTLTCDSYGITVTNPDGQAGTLANALVVTVPEDVNRNGVVDAMDVQSVASRWLLTAANPDPDGNPGTPNYETRFDLDGDGTVTVADIMRVAAAWGTVCE